MSDFGSFLGSITGKVANAASADRKLKCYSCDKITNHIHISYSDVMKAEDKQRDNGWRDVLGVTMDLIPAAMPITLGNSYACNDCKRIRFEGGMASNGLNKSCYYL